MAKIKSTQANEKRAAALRDNLKRRKQKAQTEKQSKKESKDGTSEDK